MRVCRSPWLIAAYHGLHRLRVPRHPPHAFARLTTSNCVKQSTRINTIYILSRRHVPEGPRDAMRIHFPRVIARLSETENRSIAPHSITCQTAPREHANNRAQSHATCNISPVRDCCQRVFTSRTVAPLRQHATQTSFFVMVESAVVSTRGARRWSEGHPWIFRSDVVERPAVDAGTVAVHSTRGQPLGWALWSPLSEISLRLLERNADAAIDADWWRLRLAGAVRRRAPVASVASAYRLVHAEADGCPSVVCDRYGDYLVLQLQSAGAERFRREITDALRELSGTSGILARNDAPVREREGLPRETVLLHGDVPHEVEVLEHGVRYLAAPWDGQKTGAFLDQRENRAMIGSLARGKSLDCFTYHGSFALHLAARANDVVAVDSSLPALARAERNAALNGCTNVRFREANVFEFLRSEEERGARYDTIVLDPPAFAKNRGALSAAIRGYKEINLRAMRILAPGGLLFTASCSYHLTRPTFLEMLEVAAADSGRRIALRELRGQPLDHPEILTIPESGYVKGAILEAMA